MTNLERIKCDIQNLSTKEFNDLVIRLNDLYRFGFPCQGKLLCDKNISCERCFCDWLDAPASGKLAYYVRDPQEFSGLVTFANSPKEAISIALTHEMFDCACEEDLESRRFTKGDNLYKGQDFLDLDDPKTKVFLVKECGFHCEYVEPEWCENCEAKDVCEDYQEYIDSAEEDADEDKI